MRRLVGRLAKLSIVIFWLVMMGSLMKREFFLPSLAAPLGERRELLLRLPFRQQWMGIYYQDRKIGYSHTSINAHKTQELSGFIIRNKTLFLLSLLEETREILLEAFTVVDNEYRIRLFNIEVKSHLGEILLRGKVSDNKLFLEIEAGGVKREEVVLLREDLLLSNTIMPYLVLPQLIPGKTYTVNLIDPLTLTSGQAKIKVEETALSRRRGRVYVVKLDYQGLCTTSWISEDGEILKEESPLGWMMKRESKEEAMAMEGEGLKLDEMIPVPLLEILKEQEN